MPALESRLKQFVSVVPDLNEGDELAIRGRGPERLARPEPPTQYGARRSRKWPF